MAAFALSAVGATGAQALTADVGTDGQTLTGENLPLAAPHEDHKFTLEGGRAFTCNTVIFDGTIKHEDTQAIVTPTYSNCFSNETQPTTVTHNGCSYRFYGGVGEGVDRFEKVTVDLDCPPDKEIQIHVYSSHENHTSGTVLCTYNVHEFVEPKGKHENTLTNTTTATPNQDEVDVTTTVGGVVVTRVVGSALVCGGATQNATYTGATRLRAYKDVAHNEQVDLSVT